MFFFSTFTKGNNFCDLLFASLDKETLPKWDILQGLTNKKIFHLPTGQVKKKITCLVEKLACPDFFFKNKKYPYLHIAFPNIWTSCIS